jgi:hypothetical protein
LLTYPSRKAACYVKKKKRKKMLNPNESLVRSFALGLVTDVRPWPHLDKEALFNTGMEFYRWFFRETCNEWDTEVYALEFMAHHEALMEGLDQALQEAAFITWFVENGFHQLPLLGWSDLAGETTRFSEPSFRLPTNTPEDTFMVQWLIWHLNRPQESTESLASEATLLRWGIELATTLPASCELDCELLVLSCQQFFGWCQAHVHTWDAIYSSMRLFVTIHPKLADEESCVWDAHFIIWFAERIANRRPVDRLSDESAS